MQGALSPEVPFLGACCLSTPVMEDKESSRYSQQDTAYDQHVRAPNPESVLYAILLYMSAFIVVKGKVGEQQTRMEEGGIEGGIAHCI